MQRGEYPPAAHEGGCPPSAEGGKIFALMKGWEEVTRNLSGPCGATSPFRGGFWWGVRRLGRLP